jgi:hypothetical protein
MADHAERSGEQKPGPAPAPEPAPRAGDASGGAASSAIAGPVPSLAAAAAAPPPGRGGDGLVAEQLRLLQRTAGNAALQRELAVQRQNKTTWSGGAVPADLVNASADPVPTFTGGTVSAGPIPGGLTKISAPEVHLPAITVSVNAATYEIEQNKSVEVGIVQSVESAKRVARYKGPGEKPGDPEQTFENDHGFAGARRDVDRLSHGGTSGAFKATKEPFFSPPTYLGADGKPKTVEGDSKAKGGMFDKPGFGSPTKLGRAELIGFSGADKFRTGLGAKDLKGGATELTYVSKSAWEIPWNLDLDPTGKGAGKDAKATLTDKAPSTVTGEAAIDAPKPYYAFTTVEQAMTVDLDTLWSNIKAAEAAGDNLAAACSIEAIKRKNPAFEVTVTCDKTDTYIGRDAVGVKIGRTNIVTVTKLKETETATLTFRLSDVMQGGDFDHAYADVFVDLGIKIGVDSAGWHVTTAHEMKETLKIGTGSYTVTGKRV